jgi:hypothetical protein
MVEAEDTEEEEEDTVEEEETGVSFLLPFSAEWRIREQLADNGFSLV